MLAEVSSAKEGVAEDEEDMLVGKEREDEGVGVREASADVERVASSVAPESVMRVVIASLM